EHDPGLAEERGQLRIAGGEDPVADPIRPERLDDLGDLLEPVLAALLADVDGDAEAGRASPLNERGERYVRVAAPGRPRAGGADADDPARCPGDRLLDDDR